MGLAYGQSIKDGTVRFGDKGKVCIEGFTSGGGKVKVDVKLDENFRLDQCKQDEYKIFFRGDKCIVRFSTPVEKVDPSLCTV